jgi:hypothetical protein
MEQLPSEAPTARYVQQASDILGVPLLPEHVPYPTQEGSIREIAYRAALRMIATERHNDRRQARMSPSYDASAWNEHWDIDSRVGAIRESHQEAAQLYGDHVQAANDVIAYHLDPNTHSAIKGPRDRFQEVVKLHMWNYIEYPGRSIHVSSDPSDKEKIQGAGLAVIAPVGSGKTRLQAYMLQAMGIGKPIGEHDDRRRRALVVVSSQAMVDQYMSVRQDNDFRQIVGPDVTYGAVWQFSKESQHDITFVIDQTLPIALERGLIKPENYHVTIADEGHLSLRGKTLDILRDISSRLLFYTATPALNHTRDLRDYFAHVEEGSLRDFVEKGILNEVRLMSFQYDPARQTELAGRLVMKAIQMGRRIVVYCPARNPSDEEGQTHIISDYIHANLDIDKSHMLNGRAAHVLASVNGKTRNQELIDAFRNGRVRALLTVNMITEGLNDPELDTVLLIDQTLPSAVNQRAGRCMRTHPGKRESWVMEMIPGPLWRNVSYYSIWQAYGYEFINQGHKVRTTEVQFYDASQQQQLQQEVQEWQPGQAVDIAEPKHTTRTQFGQNNERSSVHIPSITLDEFEKMTQMLHEASDFSDTVDEMPVRSVVFTAAEIERERFLAQASPVTELAEEFDLPRFYLQSHFDHKGIAYESVCIDGVYVRHYDAAARDNLEQMSNLRRSARRFNEETVLQIYGMRKKCLKEICPESDAQLNQHGLKYSFKDLRRIEEGFEEYPFADDTDVTLAVARTRFRTMGRRESFVDEYVSQNEVAVEDKRRNTTEGPTPPLPHIKVTDMRLLEESYEKLPVATDDHMSIGNIAEAANVSRAYVLASITAEEYKQRKIMKLGPKSKRHDKHLPNAVANEVIERIKSKNKAEQTPKKPTEESSTQQPDRPYIPDNHVETEPEHSAIAPDSDASSERNQQEASESDELRIMSAVEARVGYFPDDNDDDQTEWLSLRQVLAELKYTHAAAMTLFERAAKKYSAYVRYTPDGMEVSVKLVAIAKEVKIAEMDKKQVADYTIRHRLKKRGLMLLPGYETNSDAKELRFVPFIDRVDVCYSSFVAEAILRKAVPMPRPGR